MISLRDRLSEPSLRACSELPQLLNTDDSTWGFDRDNYTKDREKRLPPSVSKPHQQRIKRTNQRDNFWVAGRLVLERLG